MQNARKKGVTLHLLDVLVIQHAKWTAKRVRRGLFGQSIVDLSTDSWSSIQLQESAKSNPSQSATKQAKKTPRGLRSFAQARIQNEYPCQGVGCTKVGDNDFFADAESQVVGDEEPMIFDR